MGVKWVQAHEARDCGPACLAAVCLHYGVRVDVGALATLAAVTRQGARLDKLRDAAWTLGFDASCGKMLGGVLEQIPLPCILHLNREEGGHYVVLYKLGQQDALGYGSDSGRGRRLAYGAAAGIYRPRAAIACLFGKPA